jgi:putative DNA primase/helicase
MKTTPTPELIRAALQHISAYCSRDEWAKVFAAIKSEFDNETGFALADQWSQTAPENYNAKNTRDTWKSVKASGGVTIGTLLFMAKQNGFTLPKPDQAPAQPDPATMARLASERAAKQQADQAQQQAAHAHAASEAALLWQQASETGASPYLTRKGVQPYGVRFAADGWVLVPLIDALGKLWNVQRIAPSKPANGGTDKLFLKGGRKSGLWHLIGDLGTDHAGPAVLLIGEGYATCASTHEATGRPVAVAFGAGNLLHVAKALHQAHPAALIVICGDDDAATHARTGDNPGRDKATAAARAVAGLAVFSEGLPAGASDFNDMHAAAGLESVRAFIEAAIDAHQTKQAAAQSTQTKKQGQHTPSPNKTSPAGRMLRPALAMLTAFMTPSPLTIPACGFVVLTKTANASRPNGFAAPWRLRLSPATKTAAAGVITWPLLIRWGIKRTGLCPPACCRLTVANTVPRC